MNGFREMITLNGRVLKILGKPLPPYEKSGKGLSGVLLVSRDGTEMHCHECGRMFKNVGVHSAMTHGVYHREYKDRHGLFRQEVLAAPKTKARLGSPDIGRFVAHRFKSNDPATDRMRQAAKTQTAGSSKTASRNVRATCLSQMKARMEAEAKKQGVSVERLRAYPPTPIDLIGDAVYVHTSWVKAKAAASGKNPSECSPYLTKQSQEDLLSAFRAYFLTYQAYPHVSDLGRNGLPSTTTIRRVFGGASLNQLKRQLEWPVNPPGHPRGNCERIAAIHPTWGDASGEPVNLPF